MSPKSMSVDENNQHTYSLKCIYVIRYTLNYTHRKDQTTENLFEELKKDGTLPAIENNPYFNIIIEYNCD